MKVTPEAVLGRCRQIGLCRQLQRDVLNYTLQHDRLGRRIRRNTERGHHSEERKAGHHGEPVGRNAPPLRARSGEARDLFG